jgi:Tol biopolymer transport system component
VAFWSEARNLVEGDNNRNVDIFVRDRLAGTTERVSISSAGAEGNGDSGGYPIEANVPSISADGRHVAFSSEAANLVAGGKRRWWIIPDPELHVFVRDRLAGTTERVSVSSAGEKGDGKSEDPSISADGTYVAFCSEASNLVGGDNNRRWDIFVRDRVAGTTERVSISSAGAEAWADCSSPSISADGRYVAFSSEAENLVPGGRKLWWGIRGENLQIFVRDRLAGTTERVSVSSAGAKGNRQSRHPSISADGRYVAFSSKASNLVAGDSYWADVFVYYRLPRPAPEALPQVHPKEPAPEESKNHWLRQHTLYAPLRSM